jgi:predicted Rossmann fold nucleotide-binding protein DprA/Smf involved in DNA uptake
MKIKRVAVIGSRRMSPYGREVISKLMKELKGKAEVVTIEVSGCNWEVARLGADKVLKGENFQKLNEELAEYADMLVVIEGGKNSGTILSAAKFVEKNKNVYCVPGRIIDEGSFATNWLIEQGAIPLTDVADLTEGFTIDDNG